MATPNYIMSELDRSFVKDTELIRQMLTESPFPFFQPNDNADLVSQLNWLTDYEVSESS